MDSVREQVERWCSNNNVLKFVSVDAENYQIILETSIKGQNCTIIILLFLNNEVLEPVAVISHASEVEDWAKRMTTYLGRRQRSLTDLLEEARKSLMLTKESENTTSTQFATPLVRTAESVKHEVNQLIADNNGLLKLIEFQEENHTIQLSVGEQVKFSLVCTPEWNIKQVISDDDQLKDFVSAFTVDLFPDTSFRTFFTEMLQTIKDNFPHLSQPKTPFSFEDTRNNISGTSTMRSNLAAAIARTRDDINVYEPTPEEQENENSDVLVNPTEDDWSNIIIPTINQYLVDDHMDMWQIDEWLGQIRLELQKCTNGDYESCLEYIHDNIFSGGEIPRQIRRFFPKFQPSYVRRRDQKWRFPLKSTQNARKILQQEYESLQSQNSRGYFVTLIGNNLFHWRISLHSFDKDSNTGNQLLLYTVSSGYQHPPTYQYHKNKTSRTTGTPPPAPPLVIPGGAPLPTGEGPIDPIDIVFEIKFPLDFPNSGSPLFRLVRPKFTNFDEDLFSFQFPASADEMSTTDTTTTTTTTATSVPAELSSKQKSTSSSSHPLSVSMQLEKEKWSARSIIDFIETLRSKLAENNSIQIDMNSSAAGTPTEGSFWEEYCCISLSGLVAPRPASEVGGKIYLPPEALSDILKTGGGYTYDNFISYPYRGDYPTNTQSPMIFEVSAQSSRRSFCGVMEFIAPPGYIAMPDWIIDHLGIKLGDMVQVRKVKLPQGSFVKLQPHAGNSMHSNTKAMLEWVLRRFVALTEGDTIEIVHDNIAHKFDVLECKPEKAIAITDSELEVAFAQALDGTKLNPTDVNSGNHNSQNSLAVSAEIEPDHVEAALKRRKVSPVNETHETMKVDSKKEEIPRAGTMEVISSSIEGKDFVICPNCKHKLPMGAADLHIIGCERRNWFCKDCDVVVPKGDKELHLAVAHTVEDCEGCGESMEKRLLAKHKLSECGGRTFYCTYCKLKMQFRQWWTHERDCGSVTEVCFVCKMRFPRRELEGHQASCTGNSAPSVKFNPFSPVGSVPSPLRKASPSYRPYANRDDVFLCETCSSPFPTFDELQVHYLVTHAPTVETVKEKQDTPTPTVEAVKEKQDAPTLENSALESKEDMEKVTSDDREELDSTEANSSDDE